MKNIVACVDFSDTTSAVIETAATLATALNTKLYLLNVVVFDVNGIGYDQWMVADNVIDRIRNARTALNELRDPLAEHGLDVSTVLLEESGNSVKAILDEANRLETGLMIAGSHGHGAIYRLVLGSTSDGLVRNARCPVLIVPLLRPPEREVVAVHSAQGGEAH